MSMVGEDIKGLPVFPGYQVQGELGRGGMGVVYRARDLKRQEVVALKTMQWADPGGLYLFKQEFRALAGLAHANLVALHELVSDGQQWFFTMELIEGCNVLDHIRGDAACQAESLYATRLGPGTAQIVRLRAAFVQLARGVQFLHDAGKLHRDIKPGNVLVTREGRVVLLDFGLAAELDRSGLHQSTEPHLLGTVAYMAPEQAASQPVSAASDWYAVGVMLYEALTGRLPYQGPALEVLMNKQRQDPTAPRTLIGDVPEDLSVLAMELLRRDAATRPAGADVLRRLGDASASPAPMAAPPVAAPASTPLIGRHTHLQVLADALHATRAGHTVVVNVHGRSGVGKSFLVRAFLDGLVERDEAVVLAGRCYEQEAVPYKALDSLVDALCRFLVHLPLLQAEALLPRDVLALARVFPVLRRVEAIATAPPRPLDATDAQEVRRRALAALRELLGRLGDRRPLVLFIDDLQWGDVDSAALLIDLLRPPDEPTLLLAVAYRSEEAAASPCLSALFAAARSHEGLDRRELAIEPLTMEEGRALAHALLDTSIPNAAAHAEVIAREAGGNPFFVLELVQHAMGAGTGAAAPEVCAASSIRLGDVLWDRVMRLPESGRRLLEVVAVAGRPLRQAEAYRAAGIPSVDTPTLALLRADRFLRSAGPADRDEIETYHDRVRETVVAHLSPTTLMEHHRELARELAASGDADPELVAVHLAGAGDTHGAGKHYVRAAAQASDALAFERAAKLYRLALELGEYPAVEQRALRTCMGDALANAGRGSEAAHEYLRAADGAPASEALELRRRAALQLLSSGHVDEGLEVLREVLAAVGMHMPATPRRAFWSLVLRLLQLRLRGLGYHLKSAEDVPADELTRIDICSSASLGLSMVDTIQGAYFQTRSLLLSLAAGEPRRLARSLAMQAGHVSIGGTRSHDRTTLLLQMADELAQRVEDPYPRGVVAMIKGVAAAFEGNWRLALAFCDSAEQVFRTACTGAVWELDSTQRFALWALMYMGNVPEVARRLPVLLKEAQDRDDLYAVMNLNLVVGTFARLAADEPETARAEIDQAMSRWSRQGFHVQHLNRLHDEVQIEIYRGDGRAAWDRISTGWPTFAASHFKRVQQERITMSHLHARAALAAAMGTPGPAPLLQAAERDARQMEKERVPWGTALAFLVRACAALRRGSPDTAELLRAASARLDAADMPLHAAVARRHLGLLKGDDAGRAMSAQAEQWMRDQKIQNPARLSAMLAPG